jgi:hypothetical protein
MFSRNVLFNDGFFFFSAVRSLHPLMIKFSDVSEKHPAAILKVPGAVQGILIVRPCILIVAYVYLLLSTFS